MTAPRSATRRLTSLARIATGLVSLAVLAGLLIAWGMTRDHSVEVPKVVGSNLDSAISMLSEDGFKVGDIERVHQPVPNNQVVGQDPSGDADKDCTIFGWFCSNPKVDLTVSGGPGQVEVRAHGNVLTACAFLGSLAACLLVTFIDAHGLYSLRLTHPVPGLLGYAVHIGCAGHKHEQQCQTGQGQFSHGASPVIGFVVVGFSRHRPGQCRSIAG